jgi:hypothetical protein
MKEDVIGRTQSTQREIRNACKNVVRNLEGKIAILRYRR